MTREKLLTPSKNLRAAKNTINSAKMEVYKMAINYEKILEKLLFAVERLPEEQRSDYDYYTAHAAELHKCAGYNAGFALADLAADLREGIAQQTAKTAGRGNARKSALHIIKTSSRDDLRGAWEQDGKQILCNGYLAIALNSPINDLPAAENQTFDALNCIEPASRNSGAYLPVPTAAELRAYIKQRGAELKAAGMKEKFPLYDFGDGLPAVDARFLLDIVEILPGASFRASSYRPDIGGIYFESAGGFGILLPVRKHAAQKSA